MRSWISYGPAGAKNNEHTENLVEIMCVGRILKKITPAPFPTPMVEMTMFPN